MEADFSTPSRRSCTSRKSLGTPANIVRAALLPHVVISPICPELNDDDAERRERQRERVRELQRNVLSSPATPAERRLSLSSGIAGLTHSQLTEHYANCMKLSAENKITTKNAFGLHLIDYMSELLKKTDGITNFQMASCTLDASAKIYASRVDCIYADAFKMASGLGLAEDPRKSAEPGDDEMPTDTERTVKKKKKVKKSVTVETNVKSLNLNKLELGFQADAVFLKMSRAFEEGGVNGLLFKIPAKNDSSELLLDASAPYICTNEPREFWPISVPKDMTALLRRPETSDAHICPSLSSFSFINKDTFMEDEDDEAPRKKTGYTFDIDSVPEPIEENIPSDNEDGLDIDGNDVLRDDDDEVAVDHGASDDFSIANSNDVEIRNSALKKNSGMVSAVSMDTVSDLTHALAKAPSEYSYFDHNLLSTWAGPNHWRLRQFPKSKASLLPQQEAPPKKAKKSEMALDFGDLSLIDEKLFVRSKNTKLSKATLKLWNPDRTTLPDDLFYDPKKLCYLNLIDLYVSYATRPENEVCSNVGEYNYDNDNDRENYCPDVPLSQDDDEDDDDNSATFPGMTQNFATPGRNSSVVQEQNLETAAYTGGNLVEQPQKVEKVNISYAKTAKKIDMKKLKLAMWDILVHKGAENKENVDQNEPCSTVVKEPMKFSELYRLLPSKVSSNTAKNLSVPVAFVCLLHLANENNLMLENQGSTSDFIITQG